MYGNTDFNCGFALSNSLKSCSKLLVVIIGAPFIDTNTSCAFACAVPLVSGLVGVDGAVGCSFLPMPILSNNQQPGNTVTRVTTHANEAAFFVVLTLFIKDPSFILCELNIDIL